jgi:hypothetical protein
MPADCEAWVHENVPGRPKLMVIRRFPQDDDERDTGMNEAKWVARSVLVKWTAGSLLVWCDLDPEQDIDLAASPHAEFARAVITVRAMVGLEGQIPAACQAALDAALSADHWSLADTIARAADR